MGGSVTFRTKLIVVLFIGIGGSCISAPSRERWPDVQDVNTSYQIDDPPHASFDLTIRGRFGDSPIYMLTCHSGDLDDPTDFNYSGFLECRLASLYSRDTVGTLLTETMNQTTDWQNRGRFMKWHLLPGCAEYPDWGRIRTFELRGMDLTIALSDFRFSRLAANQQGPRSYKVNVSVKNDPKSDSSIAQRSKAPQPIWFYDNKHRCT